MRTAIYDPLNDFLFYKVMGEKGDETQFLGFINAVLGKTGDDRFTGVKILENKTFTPEVKGDKSSTFDVRAVLSSGARVNVEVQLRNCHNMGKRSLYYWSREFSGSLAAGQDYSELPDVISINIVDYDYPSARNFHSSFHLWEDAERELLLTGALEIHFLNMVRYRKQGGVMDKPLDRWLTWFDAGSPPELVAEVVKMDEAIQVADDRLMYVTEDKEAARAYWRHQMALSDRTSELNYARDEGLREGVERGIEQGIEQGVERGMETVARNALAKGLPIETICDITGLDAETINSLE
jgi:predicted transposase/invertase (TIGR01784 family)